MHYRPEDGHGLPHNPFKAVVAPRPIGWISTVDAEGRANLAPYSFFMAVADAPPMVMFSVTGRKPDESVKDSLANIRETGEFAVNFVGWDLRDQMNLSSGGYGHGEDEFEIAGLEKAPCLDIRAPRVAAAAATFECLAHQEVVLPGDDGMMNVVTFGRVVRVHLRDDCVVDGIFDLTRHQPVARCGYKDYAVVREVFQMIRPAGAGHETGGQDRKSVAS
ncbi:MAG TPA: flavin reductase family protein [Paracoccaceae bacterium]|nr:flavin reductase family protein [Paracoccaceae bacterium]